MKKLFVLSISVGLINLSACKFDKGELPKPQVASMCDSVTYTKTIAPIITKNCISCHKSGFSSGDFTTYAGVKQKADASSLKTKVITELLMPPTGPLSVQDRDKIRCWLDNGAKNN